MEYVVEKKKKKKKKKKIASRRIPHLNTSVALKLSFVAITLKLIRDKFQQFLRRSITRLDAVHKGT